MKAAMETGNNYNLLFPGLRLLFVSGILRHSLTFPIIAAGIKVSVFSNKGGGKRDVPTAF